MSPDLISYTCLKNTLNLWAHHCCQHHFSNAHKDIQHVSPQGGPACRVCVCVCPCPSCRCIVSLGQSGRVFTANYCSRPHSHIQLDTKSFRQKKKKKSATKWPVISEGTNMKIIPEFHAKSISIQWSRYKTSYHIKESVHRHFCALIHSLCYEMLNLVSSQRFNCLEEMSL